MSEARLLWFVLRYPHPTALARHVRDGRTFAGIRRLEACGLVTRRRGEYRLTRRGRDELAMTHVVTQLLARTRGAFPQRAVIWAEFEAAAPEVARPGKERLDRLGVALLGTLRKDGSPRISPVEPYFVQGHLLFGAMTWSLKARDLLSDTRCVLHSAVTAPDAGEREVKLYGRACEVRDQRLRGSSLETRWAARPPEDARVFSLDIEQAALVEWDLERGEMSLRRWSPDDGVSEVTRSYP